MRTNRDGLVVHTKRSRSERGGADVELDSRPDSVDVLHKMLRKMVLLFARDVQAAVTVLVYPVFRTEKRFSLLDGDLEVQVPSSSAKPRVGGIESGLMGKPCTHGLDCLRSWAKCLGDTHGRPMTSVIRRRGVGDIQ